MFGPRRCRNTRVPLPGGAIEVLYWNQCKGTHAARHTCSPSRVALQWQDEALAALGTRTKLKINHMSMLR